MAEKRITEVMMDDTTIDASKEITLVFSIANTLRGPYKPERYKDVIIPMIILRRLECALAATKKDVVDTYKNYGNNVFCSINTSGFNTDLNGLAYINLSHNEFVHECPANFPGRTVQTVVDTQTDSSIKRYMMMNADRFSFRFLSWRETQASSVDQE